MSCHLIVRSDGACRYTGTQPEAAAKAFVLLDAANQVVAEGGELIHPPVSSNVAEYLAAIWGVERAAGLAATQVTLIVDSQLVAHQLLGVYQVKHVALQVLHQQLRDRLQAFPEGHEVRWESRDNNRRADALCRRAMRQVLSVALPPPGAPWRSVVAPQWAASLETVLKGLAELARRAGPYAEDLLLAQGVDVVVLGRQVAQALDVARRRFPDAQGFRP